MRSLGIRLALVISGVLSLLMLITGLWLDRQLTAAMRAEEVRQAEVHASTLLASLQTLMLNGQGTLARSWLDRMHGESGIIDIEVLRRDGKEAFTDLDTVQAVNGFLGYPRFERRLVVPHHPGRADSPAFQHALRGEIAVDWTAPGVMTLLMPIQRRSECLACHGYDESSLRGVLKLSLSTVYGEKHIGFMRDRLWAIAAGLVALLGMVMWLVLRFSVLRPIADLRDAITRVGQGDRRAKLTAARRDELGELAAVFNRMQEQLAAGETRIRAVMDNVADAVITLDERGVIESANRAVRRVFGYAPEELPGRRIETLLPPPYHDGHEQFIKVYLAPEGPGVLGVGREVSGRRKDGTSVPIDLAVSEMRLHGGRHFIGIARDITERKAQEAAIKHRALHDALTDLPNRALFSDRLHQAILSAAREAAPLALIIMDLDRFKEINDTLGHSSGDAVLRQTANRVRGVLRESDTVARLGGDEFAVLLPAADLDDAVRIARKLLSAVDEPFVAEAQPLRVGASLGIALFPDHGRGGAVLMKRADIAMYQAKRAKTGFAVYDSSQDRHSPRNLALIGELRAAMDENQLLLLYQPKVNLRTGRVAGAEALLRWRHPRLGLLYPNDFIPLAEQAGLIRQVTVWVLRQALAQWRAWREAGITIEMAVNISAYDLHDGAFAQETAALLREFGGDRARPLRLEIAEAALMSDPGRALEAFRALGASGVAPTVDDFGTGYSSLVYLKQLPAAELKIDKSFVVAMGASDDAAVIVRSAVELAHNIGLSAAAEGVEDRQTYDLLAALRCDAAQGFYISRPMAPDEFSAWLRQTPLARGA